jgi:hypothetical protein
VHFTSNLAIKTNPVVDYCFLYYLYPTRTVSVNATSRTQTQREAHASADDSPTLHADLHDHAWHLVRGTEWTYQCDLCHLTWVM